VEKKMMINYYQDNQSRKLFSYEFPLNDNGEFTLYIGSIKAEDGSGDTPHISIPKGESCLIGTGLRINLAGLFPIFSHSHHVHIERWFLSDAMELMLQIANPMSTKLSLELGDEIAAFVLVRNALVDGARRANTTDDLV
jgi:hypothetical protein